MARRTISARLNEKAFWELECLKSLRGGKKNTTTEILTEAIHHLYDLQSLTQQKMTAFDFLKETGFIGAIEGDIDDSTHYKNHVNDRVR